MLTFDEIFKFIIRSKYFKNNQNIKFEKSKDNYNEFIISSDISIEVSNFLSESLQNCKIVSFVKFFNILSKENNIRMGLFSLNLTKDKEILCYYKYNLKDELEVSFINKEVFINKNISINGKSFKDFFKKIINECVFNEIMKNTFLFLSENSKLNINLELNFLHQLFNRICIEKMEIKLI